MKTLRRLLCIIIRKLLCIILALATSAIGLNEYFSDYGLLGLSFFDRLLVIFLLYPIACLIIGAIAREFWKISLLSSFGPVFVGGMIFFSSINEWRIREAAFYAFYFSGLVIVPLISFLFGYLGAWLSFKLVKAPLPSGSEMYGARLYTHWRKKAS